MKRRSCLFPLAALGLLVTAAAIYAYFTFFRFVNAPGGDAAPTAVQLPPGFTADVFAGGLSGPRFIHFGPDGALYVADRGNNRVVALADTDGDGRADTTRIFAADIGRVHSIVYHDGAWYAGVPSGVIRLVDTDGDGVADERTTLVDDYPTEGTHSTRTIAFLPDGRMVVSIGSSCNVCEEADPRRAAVVVYESADATGERLYATGLRNAVGLAVQPATGRLWASNNGRDLMGDDLPPETIYVVEDGAHYGWPECHNGDIVDPDMGFPGACDGVAPPVAEFQAHTAPLGITFYDGAAFPPDYRGDLFIARHGSWNRSIPVGYDVARLSIVAGEPAGPVEPFATGWLDEASGEASGRPVGLAVGPQGALYISDDKAGLIYRITYTGGR